MSITTHSLTPVGFVEKVVSDAAILPAAGMGGVLIDAIMPALSELKSIQDWNTLERELLNDVLSFVKFIETSSGYPNGIMSKLCIADYFPLSNHIYSGERKVPLPVIFFAGEDILLIDRSVLITYPWSLPSGIYSAVFNAKVDSKPEVQLSLAQERVSFFATAVEYISENKDFFSSQPRFRSNMTNGYNAAIDFLSRINQSGEV